MKFDEANINDKYRQIVEDFEISIANACLKFSVEATVCVETNEKNLPRIVFTLHLAGSVEKVRVICTPEDSLMEVAWHAHRATELLAEISEFRD